MSGRSKMILAAAALLLVAVSVVGTLFAVRIFGGSSAGALGELFGVISEHALADVSEEELYLSAARGRGGDISFPSAYGQIVALLPLGDALLLFRERGVQRLRAKGDERDFTLSDLFSGAHIYGEISGELKENISADLDAVLERVYETVRAYSEAAKNDIEYGFFE